DVCRIFASHQQGPARLRALALRDQAGVGDALEDAFAVLIAGPRIAQFQGARQAIEVAVGFVTDDPLHEGTLPHQCADFRVQSDIAVQRLLNETEMTEELPQRRGRGQLLPKGAEVGKGMELLIAVETEQEIRRGVRLDHRGDALQPVAVADQAAAHLDLELPEAVSMNTARQGYRPD